MNNPQFYVARFGLDLSVAYGDRMTLADEIVAGPFTSLDDAFEELDKRREREQQGAERVAGFVMGTALLTLAGVILWAVLS